MTETPLSDHAMTELWPTFLAAADAQAKFANREQWAHFNHDSFGRLDQGRLAYGDDSFRAPLLRLFAEAEQEAIDLCNWGFIAWVVATRTGAPELVRERLIGWAVRGYLAWSDIKELSSQIGGKPCK